MQTIPLVEVDEVKVTIIMDNTIDVFMASNKKVERYSCNTLESADGFSPLLAEHGFSAMIQIKYGDQEKSVLLDAGVSPEGILHNMNTLGVNIQSMEAIILSHGHSDHTLGISGVLQNLNSKKIPLIAHPDAFLERKVMFPDGREMSFSPPLALTELDQEKITCVKKSDPTLLVDNTLLVSGEIPRITEFETGFPLHHTKRDGEWQNDPLIKDDQCVIVNVRGQGLVVITGCGHSGIINTIRYAQALTGVKKVYAALGGFHLTGGFFEKIIPDTIAELENIDPTYLIPGHCTGWSAIHKISEKMPAAFIPNNVGSTFVFQAKKD